MKILVHASAGLPTHIQWMPPGLQTVQPMGFDKPFEIMVTPELAARADRELQRLRGSAAAGRGPEPYIDANHKDEARLAKARRFWWGGSDPKSGGIRVDVEWTGAGARVVREGELPYLSPSWALHKVTKEFLGLTRNVGGLVPASAFHSIQAFAKASAKDDPFFARVAEVMKAEGITEEMARKIVLEKEHDLFVDHLYMEMGIDREQAKRLGIQLPVEAAAKCVIPTTCDTFTKLCVTLAKEKQEKGKAGEHALVIQAKAKAEAEGIDFSAACLAIAKAQPALYDDYRRNLGLR